MISNKVCSIIFSVIIFGCLTVAQSATSSPLGEFKNAAVTARIAAELNQQNLSNELKNALLESARPEDTVAIKSLLAHYKRDADLNFSSVIGQLFGTRKGGEIVFSIEMDETKPDRFAINGREWKAPPKGSLLNALDREVFQVKKTRSAKLDLFIPEAFGDVSSSPAAKMAAYIFVSARSNANGWVDQGDAAAYLSRKDVFSALLRGADFPQTTTVEKAKSFLDAMMMAPIKVQCTPDGAKGFALVAGSDVEFLAKDDLSVILKSRGNDQALKFEVRSDSLASKADEITRAIASVKPLAEDEDASKAQVAAATVANTKLLLLCKLGLPPASPRTKELCQNASRLQSQIKRLTLVNPNNASRLASNEYVKRIAKWLESNRGLIEERAEELAATLMIRDHTGTISACANPDCTKTTPSDPESVFGYRIPPNNTEDSVKEAIAFKPRSSPKSKAEIRYSCPTKNQACERVELINGDDLSGEDLVAAKALVDAANKDLDWKESHASVSQPVSILRALAPCCNDTKCRATVIESGVNLIPTKGTKPSGVSQ